MEVKAIWPSLLNSCEHTWTGELFLSTLGSGCSFALWLWLANPVSAPPSLLSTWSGPCGGGSRKYRCCSSSGCQPGRWWRAILQHQERSFSWSLQPTGEWAPSDRWGRNCKRQNPSSQVISDSNWKTSNWKNYLIHIVHIFFITLYCISCLPD